MIIGVDLPDDLIALEREAEQARARLAELTGADYDAQWKTWREAVNIVQAAITAHAEATGENRMAVEMAVKKTVRHPA